MPLRNARPVTVRPRGACDSLDGSNAFPGAMQALTNLIPSPTTTDAWVPRPASDLVTSFAGFTSPSKGNALLQVGSIVYGMIAETTGTYAGKDVPFVYDLVAAAFQPVTIPGGAASLPTSPVTTGDWTPPIMAQVGTRIIITHPGFAGGSDPFFGWIDVSSFSSASLTGDTHATTTVNNISSSALTAGWEVGMLISASDGSIPANTTIVSIASGGASLVLSQAATGSGTGVTLTVTGGTPATPLYASGNTNLHVLAAVPVAVGQFNGRAYFAVQNGVALSDSGNPTQITNASQVLTFSNGLAATAIGALPIQQSTGGILQALIVFQGDNDMQQITGDPTTSNLAVNQLGIGVGTLSPLTICQTLAGLAFVAPDGLRVLNFLGAVSEPIGANGDGICYPFLSAIAPSRMCAAFNQNVMRISVQNGSQPGEPQQEWWYDFKRRTWSGPHSFPAALIVPYQGTPNHGFTLFASGVNAKLFSSSVTPTINDTYVENGTQMTFAYETVLFPDTGGMSMNGMSETTLTAAISRNQTWTVIAKDEQGNTLGQVQLFGPTAADTIWGSFTWGAALWNGAGTFVFQQPLNWPNKLIFKQMVMQITGNCALNTQIGNLNMLIARLGYLTQIPSVQPQTPPVPAQKQLTSDSGIVLTDDSGTVILMDS